MAHRILHDPEADGWERSDFPIVCETCLGPNPYVRMQRIDYGAECHISKRPYTKFRWRPGANARYKSTIICQEVAKAKNVCQVCLLDLNHNLPVQVRDQLTNAVVEDIPESQVGLEYQLALKESRGELGKEFKNDEVDKDNEQICRLARTTPYYKRNRAQICTFWLRGECKRGAECPYRHELPETGELAQQNIRDRYYGVNDPVARKMLKRLGERPHLEPPEDQTITTLYVGNVERTWSEDDLRRVFKKYGDISRIKVVHNKSCAFVTYMTRKDAELAAEKLHDALIVNGVRCKLLWGKPQTNQGQSGEVPDSGADVPSVDAYGRPLVPGEMGSVLPPRLFMPQPTNYPSMDPAQLGTAPAPQETPGAPPTGVPPTGVPGRPVPVPPQPGVQPGVPPPPWPQMRPQPMMPPPHAPLGMPPMQGMPPPRPGMLPQAPMAPPHPGALTGFGMMPPQYKGAAAAAAKNSNTTAPDRPDDRGKSIPSPAAAPVEGTAA